MKRTTTLRMLFAAIFTVFALTVSAQSDLATFDLKGKVSSCTWTNQGSSYTYSFNTAGRWTGVNGKALSAAQITVERDSKGRILSYSEEIEEYYYSQVRTFKYDTAGKVASFHDENPEVDDVATYTYDTNGRIIKETHKREVIEMGAEESVHDTYSYTYTYLASDPKGNWTKRKVTGNDGGSWTETRTIVYRR